MKTTYPKRPAPNEMLWRVWIHRKRIETQEKNLINEANRIINNLK